MTNKVSVWSVKQSCIHRQWQLAPNIFMTHKCGRHYLEVNIHDTGHYHWVFLNHKTTAAKEKKFQWQKIAFLFTVTQITTEKLPGGFRGAFGGLLGGFEMPKMSKTYRDFLYDYCDIKVKLFSIIKYKTSKATSVPLSKPTVVSNLVRVTTILCVCGLIAIWHLSGCVLASRTSTLIGSLLAAKWSLLVKPLNGEQKNVRGRRGRGRRGRGRNNIYIYLFS